MPCGYYSAIHKNPHCGIALASSHTRHLAVRRQIVSCLIEGFPSRHGKFLCLPAGLTQRLLSLLDKFLTMCNGTVQILRVVIDDFIEVICRARRRVAKKPAQLRASLWCEEQGDARADQRSTKCPARFPDDWAMG
jgi:hypothetical protein